MPPLMDATTPGPARPHCEECTGGGVPWRPTPTNGRASVRGINPLDSSASRCAGCAGCARCARPPTTPRLVLLPEAAAIDAQQGWAGRGEQQLASRPAIGQPCSPGLGPARSLSARRVGNHGELTRECEAGWPTPEYAGARYRSPATPTTPRTPSALRPWQREGLPQSAPPCLLGVGLGLVNPTPGPPPPARSP